ncbi:MAG: hypothetical protein CMO98_04760 [Woeseia sp.]|nr:hypothetical protein [Woeseia sp.]|tara:strand:+ start:2234 stop:3523 length:1290 start_codon:yes stop_codon:yes gene_type:complete
MITAIQKVLTTIVALVFVSSLSAASIHPKNLAEMLKEIRKDKFDYVLPKAMRDNNVDMWIHVIRQKKPEPLALDLGGNAGVFIFTDKGGDRIERAVLGIADEELWSLEAYDLFISGEEAFEGDMAWQDIIHDFVAERDPQRIALNYSSNNAAADGISSTDYVKMINALGDSFAARVVSAENIIGDYISGRVLGEIVLDGYFGLEAAAKIDREFEKIEVGRTTLAEIDGNVFVRDIDGNENNGNDYILKGGDLITILNGAGEGIFVADLGGNGYVLRDGETGLPEEVEKIWQDAMTIREICRKNIKVGRTAGETLNILIEKAEDAGFHYTNVDQFDLNADPKKTQVHFDLHAQGVRWMDAPRISPLGADWQREMTIPLFHTFTFEYMIHMPLPKLGKGKHLYIAFHDGAVVTERGVEWPYPPDQGIRIIR